ncbi:MAG: glycoside hydrolase family 20 zincin-like fold domain-containing protein [Planctomycetia bacterium]|nr:glycoside hydrolase family 20 zincin-like fold domain-containing protein [Planctomycetia bacterium]
MLNRFLFYGCCWLGFLAGSFSLEVSAVEESPVIPIPKWWQNMEETWEIIPEKTVIALLPSASPQEEYAARRLRQHLQNRFKISIPVVTHETVPENIDTVLFLGTRIPFSSLPLPDQANGFTIDFQKKENGRYALVHGVDGQGVLYGGEALFDLMRKTSQGGVEMRLFQIRDWPSLVWRGRPHFVLMQNLLPGTLDAYLRARINYTDVRDNPNYKVNIYYPDRAAPMGFPPGVALDRENVGKMIRESQKRGMFVYGCVAAASNKNAGGIIAGFDKLDETRLYEDVNETFESLLELGVDGLWLSFDDIGQGNEPEKAIANFLQLGKKHGLSGRKLAYTPPLGDYQKIDTPFNHEAAKIPGFASIQWFFTRVPCAEDREMCQSLGLELPPAWWHNLIHLRPGFLNNANIAVTLREGHVEKPAISAVENTPYTWSDYPAEIPRPAYLELQPLSHGWHHPAYDNVRNVTDFTDNVMLWCIGGGWPEEYLVAMFGYWAWAPETHDWEKTQRAIYSYVFGPEMAGSAQKFDETLVELKKLFDLPVRIFGPNKGWPCRLKDRANREKALVKIAELERLAALLTEKAPELSALDPQRLEIIYLEPMRATAEYARKMATLDYPEYDPDASAETIQGWLKTIESELKGLKGVETYLQFWKKELAKRNDLLKKQK